MCRCSFYYTNSPQKLLLSSETVLSNTVARSTSPFRPVRWEVPIAQLDHRFQTPPCAPASPTAREARTAPGRQPRIPAPQPAWHVLPAPPGSHLREIKGHHSEMKLLPCGSAAMRARAAAGERPADTRAGTWAPALPQLHCREPQQLPHFTAIRAFPSRTRHYKREHRQNVLPCP